MNLTPPKTLSELLALYFSKSAPIQAQPVQSGQETLSPWYVLLLQLYGAYMALVLVLVYIEYQLKPSSVALFFGLSFTLYVGSAALYYADRRVLWLNQLALIVSLAALFFAVRGLAASFMASFNYGMHSPRYIALLIAGFELMAFFILRDRLRQFLAAIVVVSTALPALLVWESIPYSINFLALVYALLVFLAWHYSPALLKINLPGQAPLRYALVFALLSVVGMASVLGGHFEMRMGRTMPEFQVWLTTAGIGLALIAITYAILKRHGAATGSYLLLSVVLIVAIGLLTWHTPGILTGLFVITLGFAHGSRVLVGFGIAYLVCFVFQYYYNINTDLLMKSIALMGTGAILLGTAWWLDKLRRGAGEKDA